MPAGAGRPSGEGRVGCFRVVSGWCSPRNAKTGCYLLLAPGRRGVRPFYSVVAGVPGVSVGTPCSLESFMRVLPLRLVWWFVPGCLGVRQGGWATGGPYRGCWNSGSSRRGALLVSAAGSGLDCCAGGRECRSSLPHGPRAERMLTTMACRGENAIGFPRCRHASGESKNRANIVVLAVIGFLQPGGVSWSFSHPTSPLDSNTRPHRVAGPL